MGKDETMRQELTSLIREGLALQREILEKAASEEERKRTDAKKSKSTFSVFEFGTRYQGWYSLTLPVIEQLLPDRYDEFQLFYRDARRKGLTPTTFTISDFLLGNIPYALSNAEADVFAKLNAQLGILKSAEPRLNAQLADIKGVLQAELFDNELAAASDIAKKGHLRAAGAIGGVVLERHLGKVALDHGLTTRKKRPTIADLNELLKGGGVYDLPTWRKVQHLADLRNLCDHPNDREPTHSEVEELIEGVDRAVKNIF